MQEHIAMSWLKKNAAPSKNSFPAPEAPPTTPADESNEYPPSEYQAFTYRSIHHDLSGFTLDQLSDHYLNFGKKEGRQGNRLANRADFSGLISSDTKTLEIGPFCNPVKKGPNVDYADFLSQQELIARAKSLNLPADQVPPIRHVLSTTPLGDINEDYEAAISSHSIEHQPDLVRHLQDISRLLKTHKGRYFILIPDKRYCFDRNISDSTIAEVYEAYEQKRTTHTLRSVIEHRALTTHNDPVTHWNSDNNELKINAEMILNAVKEWKDAQGGYIDVHAWYFTPDSFATIMGLLREMGLISLSVEAIYPPRRYSNEFWAILRHD
jgi:hypothetical protein